jgi:cell division protein FtsB
MKALIMVLLTLLGILQYEFWFTDGGFKTVRTFQHQIHQQEKLNAQIAAQNDQLFRDIGQLKTNPEVVEANARRELGLIKKNEVFYQVVH